MNQIGIEALLAVSARVGINENTSSIIPNQDKKRSTSSMTELYAINLHH